MNLSRNTDSLKLQTICLFSGKTLAFLLSFFVPVILVRIFDKDAYGLYQLAIFIAGMSVPVLGLGLNSSLYYFYPVVQNKKGALLTQTILMQMMVASIMFTGVLCLNDFIVSYLDPNDTVIKASIFQIALLALFRFLSSMVEHIFILEKKALLNFFFLIAEAVIRASVVLSVALITRNIDLVVTCLTLFYLVRFIFLMIYLIYNYRHEIGLHLHLLKDQLRYALPFGGSIIVSQIGQRMDRLIVSMTLGIAQFATYSVATVFKIPMIEMYFDSIFNVALPRISKLAYHNEESNVIDIIEKILNKTIPIAIPLVIFFEMFSEPIILILFTEKYLDAVNLFRIALLTLVPRMFARGLILRAYKKTHVQFKIALVQLVVALCLGILLSIWFGLLGAILSYLIAISISYFLAIRIEARLLNITLRKRINFDTIKRVLKSCIIPCVCAFPMFLFETHMNPVFTLFLGGLIYFPLLALYYRRHGILKLRIHDFSFKRPFVSDL